MTALDCRGRELVPFLCSCIPVADPNTSTLEIADEGFLNALTEDVIRPTVRRRLQVTLSASDTSRNNQDALELVGDIQIALLSAIQRSAGQVSEIADPNAYAARTAANSCYQYLRDRFPVRTQQTNKIRYLISHGKEFNLSQDATGQWVCSLSGKHERHGNNTTARDLTRSRYKRVIYEFVAAHENPVGLETIVDAVMDRFEIRERTEMPLNTDPERDSVGFDPPAYVVSPDLRLELVDRLRQTWSILLDLSPNHRKALLFNLRDGDDCLITVLPLTGVASLSEIAESLEMPSGDLAELWRTLPWDDLKIADHLGITRQQVINLRYRARARLIRETGGAQNNR